MLMPWIKTKHAATQCSKVYRLATSMLRVLPDYLILGEQKCGTTSLYYYLIQHPRVEPPSTKEINFFDKDGNYDMGMSRYRANFPLRLTMKNKITGEATPNYLRHKDAPGRIRSCLVDVKLIVLIRNPIARAFSHYNMNRRNHFEDRTFADAIDGDIRMLESGQRTRAVGYVDGGFYDVGIKRWLGAFGRDRFLFLKSEEMGRDPLGTVNRTCCFLGIKPMQNMHESWLNVNPDRTTMCQKTRDKLYDTYWKHNESLGTLIGDKFDYRD